MKKIQYAKNTIPEKLGIGETCFPTISIKGGGRSKTHMHCNQLFFNYNILTNKLYSYEGDLQLRFSEDHQQAVQTITSRKGTIIAGIFNKITNQNT